MKKLRIVPSVDEAVLSPQSKVEVNCLQAFAEETLEENNRLWEENAHLKDEVAVNRLVQDWRFAVNPKDRPNLNFA